MNLPRPGLLALLLAMVCGMAVVGYVFGHLDGYREAAETLRAEHSKVSGVQVGRPDYCDGRTLTVTINGVRNQSLVIDCGAGK